MGNKERLLAVNFAIVGCLLMAGNSWCLLLNAIYWKKLC